MTSLTDLPMEILHRIFDELDGAIIFLSVRAVCQQLRAAVGTYQQYKLDMTFLFKPDFCQLLHLIRPECVTSLSLSDEEMRLQQIHLFFSLIDFGRFIRLHSLTLLHIGHYELRSVLKHAVKLSLISLILQPRSYHTLNELEIAQHLLSIMVQPTLRRLELLDMKIDYLIALLQQPIEFKFQYLRMEYYDQGPCCEIIARSPNLKTLVLDQTARSTAPFKYQNPKWFSTPYRELVFLTMANFSLFMSQAELILSQMLSLRHLKIITRPSDVFNGSQWEELIKTKLPCLNKFEFYARFSRVHSKEKSIESMLNTIIAPYCTPFWTEEKRWQVICNFWPTIQEAEIYTSPICKPYYSHRSNPKMRTMCNFEKDNQPSSVLKSVNEVHVDIYRMFTGYSVSEKNHCPKLVSDEIK